MPRCTASSLAVPLCSEGMIQWPSSFSFHALMMMVCASHVSGYCAANWQMAVVRGGVGAGG